MCDAVTWYSADERKKRVNVTSFICTEAMCPLGRYTFEELGTWPLLGGADSFVSRYCAESARGISPWRGLQRPVINIPGRS